MKIEYETEALAVMYAYISAREKKEIQGLAEDEKENAIDYFWEYGEGADMRRSIELYHLPLLSDKIIKALDLTCDVVAGADVDLMQLTFDFLDVRNFDFAKADKVVDEWLDKDTSLYQICEPEWSWELREGNVELYVWIDWRTGK